MMGDYTPADVERLVEAAERAIPAGYDPWEGKHLALDGALAPFRAEPGPGPVGLVGRLEWLAESIAAGWPGTVFLGRGGREQTARGIVEALRAASDRIQRFDEIIEHQRMRIAELEQRPVHESR